MKIVGQKRALRMGSSNVSASSSNLLATEDKTSPTVRRAQVSKQEQCAFGWEEHEGWGSSSSHPSPSERCHALCGSIPQRLSFICLHLPPPALPHSATHPHHHPHHHDMGLMGRSQKAQEIILSICQGSSACKPTG